MVIPSAADTDLAVTCYNASWDSYRFNGAKKFAISNCKWCTKGEIVVRVSREVKLYGKVRELTALIIQVFKFSLTQFKPSRRCVYHK